MDKIFYIDSNLVPKTFRKHNPYYVLVKVVEELGYGKVKVGCYWFDIMCAYFRVSFLGYTVVEESRIKELNFENVVNDINKGSHLRKYWYWEFLCRFYGYSAHLEVWNGDDELEIKHDNETIAKIDTKKVDGWWGDSDVLMRTDIALDDMIKHGIECENCLKLKQIIRGDDVTITTEQYLRLKGYIS